MKTKKSKKLIMLPVILLMVSLAVTASGCSVSDMLNESIFNKSSGIQEFDIQLDEKEIESIIISSDRMEKKYDISRDVSNIGGELKNPFKPFFLSDDTEDNEENNILIVDEIYSKDGIEYAEIKINDSIYVLKEGDTFSRIYLVQAINENSVVLLKGDEILTIFIDEVIYD